MTTTQSSPTITAAAVLGNFIFLGPLLWIQELLQNLLTRAVTGDWGWIYPRSPHEWWSFHTMPSWGAVAAVWFALNVRFLHQQSVLVRLLIMATIGWVIEYLNGFVQEATGSEGLQVWPGSPLRYVTYGCFLWWIQNGVTWFVLNEGLARVGSAIAQSNLLGGKDISEGKKAE
ncbi:expressed unknown protein [Seminavis robusta]|uniref:Uncharacterized protein n=1 Tax=Seminavis robusta TaxID=568900 RepID=A0A9N8ECY6_9STRA|nr:expressed unknown protein [Seminavis robusta]|eukprot:Sro908_g218900.1 n/a (173) ;mRNA; f:37729-38247